MLEFKSENWFFLFPEFIFLKWLLKYFLYIFFSSSVLFKLSLHKHMINFLNLKKIDFKWEEDFPTFLWNSYTAKTLEMFKINARSIRFMSERNIKANCEIMLICALISYYFVSSVSASSNFCHSKYYLKNTQLNSVKFQRWRWLSTFWLFTTKICV